MGYEILFVSDDEMPEGHDFVLHADDEWVVILYRASAVRAQVDPDRAARVLEDSWTAFRALDGGHRGGGQRMLAVV